MYIPRGYREIGRKIETLRARLTAVGRQADKRHRATNSTEECRFISFMTASESI